MSLIEEICKKEAEKSDVLSSKHGAVIYDSKRGVIVSRGYNHYPKQKGVYMDHKSFHKELNSEDLHAVYTIRDRYSSKLCFSCR